MSLLNSDTGKETYHEMCQEFVELIVEAGIKAMSISGEVLINRLIRKDPDEDFSRPDFSKTNIGPYKILSVIKAIVNNKSALIGLATQDLKKQILSDDLLKRDGASYIDPFFMPNVPTDRLYELHEIVKNGESEV